MPVPFLQFLKSLDDLLFELLSWLVFFPITLWRTLVRPLDTMDYAERELTEDAERQYDETLSPPQYLLVALLVSHAAELAIVGQSDMVADRTGLAGLIRDDASLLLFRIMAAGLIAALLAIRLLRRQGRRVSRSSLRNPFYAQCFPAGTFVLAMGIGEVIGRSHDLRMAATGVLLTLAAFAWFAIIQFHWFKRRLQAKFMLTLWVTSVALLQCILALAALTQLV